MANSLFHLGIPLTEKLVRTAAVYFVIAILLRLAGKRDLAQLNTFDLVVMLLLSNVVQNAIIGSDNSLSGGLFGATALIALNAGVVRIASMSPVLEVAFEGGEEVLVKDGRYVESALRREALRHADVEAALRRQGANDVTEVQRALLGPGGAVIVELKPEAQPATKADVAALSAALARLENKLG